MASVKLTERCNIFLNTEMEKHVLLLLLSKNEVSSIRIWDQYIYLFADTNNFPDAEPGIKARVLLKYTDDNLNKVEEEAIIDVRYVERQLENVTLDNNEYGDFSYIDWGYEFVNTATDTGKNVVKFKITYMVDLNSINTEIWGHPYPKIENLGTDENSKPEIRISSTDSDLEIILTIDRNEFLDSKAVEL